jgi:pimeloyl-ACP methyl ester carboxylesterase
VTEGAQLLFTSSLTRLLVKPALPLYSRDRYFGKVPKTFPPILVLQSRIDPKTSHKAAMVHVSALGARDKVDFVTIKDAAHFVLWTGQTRFEKHV